MGSRKKNLELLASEMLKAWQTAHGVKIGAVSTLIGPSQVAFLIENAFSQAERVLAEDQGGKTLLMQYTRALLSQISRDMKERIETVAGDSVLDSDHIANLDAGQVMFIYKFDSLGADVGTSGIDDD
jgi:uncharacterized protein YbcI